MAISWKSGGLGIGRGVDMKMSGCGHACGRAISVFELKMAILAGVFLRPFFIGLVYPEEFLA